MMPLLIQGDARRIPLKDESIQCVVTSPPYYGLRDYKVEGQIGLEKTPEQYVATIVEVFKEVKRVLRKDGCVFLNLGDSYAGGKIGRCDSGDNGKFGGPDIGFKCNDIPNGLKPKDLIGIPWRVAFALQSDGWWLRQDIIWAKPNPMPESVTDRCTKSHEYIFLLTKSAHYYYDNIAILEPHQNSSIERAKYPVNAFAPSDETGGAKLSKSNVSGYKKVEINPDGRNKRSVWTIATCGYSGAHFATFPPALVEPCILAGSKPGDIVLDPFSGTATVGMVAIKHQREYVGIELSSKYNELDKKRLSGTQIKMIV